MFLGDLKYKLLPVSTTRVWRTYFGGAEIEKWQGHKNPKDSDRPEVWIASTVKAVNPKGKGTENEGLSEIYLPNQGKLTLKEIIDSDPESFLGTTHYHNYGNNMTVLVKMIDSLGRLTIQVHPDKEFARRVFVASLAMPEKHWLFVKALEWIMLELPLISGIQYKPGKGLLNLRYCYPRQIAYFIYI